LGFGPENKKRALSLCSAPFSFAEFGIYRLLPAEDMLIPFIVPKIKVVDPATGAAGARRLMLGKGRSFCHVSLISPNETTI
jgi:hypothetical protein